MQQILVIGCTDTWDRHGTHNNPRPSWCPKLTAVETEKCTRIRLQSSKLDNHFYLRLVPHIAQQWDTCFMCSYLAYGADDLCIISFFLLSLKTLHGINLPFI